MCLLLLLVMIARRGRFAVLYLMQALAVFGLGLMVLCGDRPLLSCALHLVSAAVYGALVAAHSGRAHE